MNTDNPRPCQVGTCTDKPRFGSGGLAEVEQRLTPCRPLMVKKGGWTPPGMAEGGFWPAIGNERDFTSHEVAVCGPAASEHNPIVDKELEPYGWVAPLRLGGWGVGESYLTR